jgi:hypothetical protein
VQFADFAFEPRSIMCAEIVKLYNALSAEIRSIRAYRRFVAALRKFVNEHRYYTAREYFDAADVA